MTFEDYNLSLNDLYYLSYLGRGRFGNVCLVHNEIFFYAIKAISKLTAERQKFGIKYILYEKNTLNCLDHPFILKLIKTLKNENWLFFLLEYITGINMSEYLDSRKNKKNTFETKFYGASLFTAIEYIHKRKIIHRDIKPSNIMIDNKGYIKLIDFGTAKNLQKDEKTHTIIGTPNFIPPEVLLGKGYSFSCDYWSIGVVAYEMIYKCYPFGGHSKDVMEIYHDIMYSSGFTYPVNKSEYKNINILIDGLLCKKVEKRICDINKIKKMKVFEKFNWNELLDRKMKPPYIPKVPNLSEIKLEEFKMKYEDYILEELNNFPAKFLEDTVYEDSSWDVEF